MVETSGELCTNAFQLSVFSYGESKFPQIPFPYLLMPVCVFWISNLINLF